MKKDRTTTGMSMSPSIPYWLRVPVMMISTWPFFWPTKGEWLCSTEYTPPALTT